MSWRLHEFDSKQNLDQALCQVISENINASLKKTKHAVLGVSGGRTPLSFFQKLSNTNLPWENVTITLTDERCVPTTSPDSNAALVQNILLQNRASKAAFLPLYNHQSNIIDLAALEEDFKKQHCFPLDIGILGMGNDGHTASIFPCADNIVELINDNASPLFHRVVPHSAAHDRITFSLSALLQTGMLILHITGKEKRRVLEQALAGDSSTNMPIRAFLHHPTVQIEIYWAA